MNVFHKDGDYAAFLDLLAIAKSKFFVKLFGVCLMPNHFHLVLQPAPGATLSPFMQWWMTSHVRRYHQHYRSHGHVWQGRFKSFPISRTATCSRLSAMFFAIQFALVWWNTRWIGRGRVCDSRISVIRFPSTPRASGFNGSISRSSIMNSRRCACV